MISNACRKRLIYTVMSVFVVWHTLAIVVAPASANSVLAQGLRVLLQPYLTLFRLDNTWDFFAPSVDSLSTSRQLLYVIEDKTGKKHFFKPEAEFSQLEPRYFWFRAWHFAVIDDPAGYADIAADLYCRKHAALHPVAITLWPLTKRSLRELISWPARGAGTPNLSPCTRSRTSNVTPSDIRRLSPQMA